jgi:hypothetical protein
MLAELWLTSLQRLRTADPFLVGGTASCVVLLSWRLWRFTLVSMIWPDEPKVLPYWVPFIGKSQVDPRGQ